MKKDKIFKVLLVLSFSLAGCSNDEFEKEAERVKKVKESNSVDSQDLAKKEKQQEKMYKKMEKPLDEVILENDLDSAEEVETTEVSKKEYFEDPNEFAKYAADILYKFYTASLPPEQYYDFQLNYGSKELISELPSEKDAIIILTSIQDMYKKNNITGEEYTLTKVELDRLQREGIFYRKVLTTNGLEYFITSIKKEDKGWKFVEDSPSPPYVEEEEQASATEENIKEEDAENNGTTGN